MNLNQPAGVAPAILRLHPGLDRGQLELIGHTQGPTMGIAGPGTGKTLAVALRGANILLRGLAQPEELVLCTYSRPAARELRQRFIALATAAGCTGDLSQVRIGTIHSLCRHILRCHSRGGDRRADLAVLNEDEQWRLLCSRFDDVFGPDLHALERAGWRWREPHLVIRHGLKFFERLCDELIDPEELIDSGDPFHAALGRSYRRYRDLLQEEGCADFDHLLRWAAELLEDGRTADIISAGIRYLICDEYQDTSHAQERILLRLCGYHGNICVVGDDDQSIYRFRGASARNLLQFPDRFPGCHAVELNVNHRSHPAIVDFYRRWMAGAADWSNPAPQGRPFRYPKSLRSSCRPPAPGLPGGHPRGGRQRRGGAGAAGGAAGISEAGAGHRRIQPGCAAPALGPGPSGRRLPGRPGAGGNTREPQALRLRGTPHRRQPPGAHRHHHSPGQGPGVGRGDRGIPGLLQFRCGPGGPRTPALLPAPSLRAPDRIVDFDQARQRYVAFSRPRGLLALTSGGPVHPSLEDAWEQLPRWDSMDRRTLARQRFRPAEQACETEPSPGPAQAAPSLKRLDVWLGRAASQANGARFVGREQRRP